MLCRRCRRRLPRRAPACLTCGAPAHVGRTVYELALCAGMLAAPLITIAVGLLARLRRPLLQRARA
jgi:hypothetical protein